MLGYAKEQRILTRNQKEAIGLLSIGTFLEYFDLMLYVHMAVLLNELFFPKYDPFVNSLLNAFAFCSTFVFRPVGAIIFGWIGDNIGRKATVIITTGIMALTCIITATLSPYSEIGKAATIVITLCRVAQGISSIMVPKNWTTKMIE
ncbi:MAG: MFS transporter [Rickettsia endosymbiont of Argas persicus]